LHYGIIGYPLEHSFSPAYFRKKFSDLQIQAFYDAYPLQDISMFDRFMAAHPGLRGLNVTIPHKETVLPMLHEIDETVVVTGAANCITIRDGYRKGYNTDVTGFAQSIIPLLKPHHTTALVLGNGGGSRAVRYVLTQLGIPWTIVSRRPARNVLSYESLTPAVVAANPLIVNTTPLGMYPHTDDVPPIPWEGIGAQHLLYDLIYNPEETVFLRHARMRGATTKNGFEMLILQAEANWEIWTRPELAER
jgi:shikimate dehydrogenase